METMTKNQAIKDIRDAGTPATMELFKILLEAVINDLRAANDDASQDQFLINQGKIQVCKEIKVYLDLKKQI